MMAVLESLHEQRWALLAIALTALAVHRFLIFNKLRRFKGPWASRFTEIPHTLAWLDYNPHTYYRDISLKYGPIAVAGPNTLVTSDPDVWIQVNGKAGYRRTEWVYRDFRFEHRRDHTFSQTDTEKHDKRKKILQYGYSGRENLELEPSIDTRIDEFVSLIRTKYLSSGTRSVPLDVKTKLQFFTFDTISTISLGRPFGMVAADEDLDDFVKSGHEGESILNAMSSLGLSWVAHVPFLGRHLGPSPEDGKGFGKMFGTSYRLVNERLAQLRSKPVVVEHDDGGNTDKRSDMLAVWLRHGLTVDDDIRSEALGSVVAGSDTTAMAMRTLLVFLMCNPRVQSKLRREIDEAVAAGIAPVAGAGVISVKAAKKLPYLQAVIRESLRLAFMVVNPLPKRVPPGGDTVRLMDGTEVFLPGNTIVGQSALVMNQDPGIYGADAGVFRPERWTEEGDPAKLEAMVRYNELAFGFGKWQCLGKVVAHMELYKTTFELIRNFEWAAVNPTNPWKMKCVIGLLGVQDLWALVTERTDLKTATEGI